MFMDKTTIHRQLQRQISKYLPENLVTDHPELQKFIEVVNLSYQNYEKDAELVELYQEKVAKREKMIQQIDKILKNKK